MKLMLMALLSVVFCQVSWADIVVYTDRSASNVEWVAQKFTAATGEKVVIVPAKYDQLLQRLQLEGEQTHADVIFVKDLVYLSELAEDGFLAPALDEEITQQVHPGMYDNQGRWVGVTYRARTLIYDPTVVDVSKINTYADLSQPEWAGRLCLRTSKASYNEGLIAGLVTAHGYEKSLDIVNGWMNNLAQNTFPNDRVIIQAIMQGEQTGCEVGLINSYYLAGAIDKAKKTASTFPVKIKFLKLGSDNVHVNGTGAGVIWASKNKELAKKFIATLLSDEAQQYLSTAHLDYPAKVGVAPAALVEGFGAIAPATVSWSEVGQSVPEAKQVISEAGYE